MKLVIVDHYNTEKVIENPQFIPTVGSLIIWRYDPPPRVTEVIYDYNNKIVYVKLV